MDFYTSDTHYFHKNIIEYCKRPFESVEEMHETMIRLWNERVSPTDSVFHLGDFGFGPWEKLAEILKRLNGKVFLVKGNHDKSIETMTKIGFAGVFLDGYHVDYEHERALFLRHKPDYDFLARPFVIDDDLHLCGHVHDEWARKGNIINVGVDQSWFTPLTLTELLNRPEENCWIAANE